MGKIKKSKCPYCLNRKVLEGYNDLETTHPELAREWNYEKNNDLKPNQIVAGTKRRVWWLGKCGHEWQAIVYTRTVMNRGCPICAKEQQSSFPEQAILYYIGQHIKNVQNKYREQNYEIDIYIPDQKIGFEYDGQHFHSNKESERKEEEKNNFYRKKGIRIIHIKENNFKNLFDIENDIIWCKVDSSYNYIKFVLENVFEILNITVPLDYNLQCDRIKIMEQYIFKRKENSIAIKRPEIIKEWNYKRNGKLNPEFLSYASNKKVWWICKNNHEYEMTVYNRYRGFSCPYCSNRKLLRGYNDFATIHPNLANEWDYEKNADLKPTDIINGSLKKIWWKCSKGHEWQASIRERNNGTSCPIYSNHKVLKGYNDLATTYPKLAEVWNYKKNHNLKPFDVTVGSERKVWWICPLGHEYQTSIKHRKNGIGCKYCSNQKVLKGYNDLVTTHPYLAKEWNYERNDRLKPDEVVVGSNKKVWWKCSKGHEWEATIGSRKEGNSCPYCSNRKVLKGYNDLATTNPELTKEWNYEKNKDLKPTDITEGSSRKVWWKCSKGHEWIVSVASRKKGNGCPQCYKLKRFQSGVNDFITKNPILAKEWDYDKNKDIDPRTISSNSTIKVWWKGKCGHSWRTSIQSRNNGNGCAICANRTVLNGYNDLMTLYPELVKDWDYDKNGSLLPNEVVAGSNKKVWWKCSKGHSWTATISNRTRGTGCPTCARTKVSSENNLKNKNPQLAKEWNYKKNIGLKPEDVTSATRKKVWWVCSEGHEWEAAILNRKNGSGCPICRKRKR